MSKTTAQKSTAEGQPGQYVVVEPAETEAVESEAESDDNKETSDEQCMETPVYEFEVFDMEDRTMLLIGESRTGKSTYKATLRNFNHTTKMEVWRGTVIPSSSTALFKINGKFVSLRILDTPGFGEVSSSVSRRDENIQKMISEFVKRDITRLGLILITVNGSSGLTSAQVTNITKCLKFLGRQVAAKTCLLVTHFETRGEEEEKEWIRKFTANPNMSFLVRACQGGFLFTGALNKTQFDIVKIRDPYIRHQKRRTAAMFKVLINGGSVSLMTDAMKDAKSMFAISESVTTSCMNLKALVPEVKATWNHALEVRLKISTLIEGDKIKDVELKERAEKVYEKMKIIGEAKDDIKTMKLDENVLPLMASYEKTGMEIREKYSRVMDLLNKYNKLDQIGSLLLMELEWCI